MAKRVTFQRRHFRAVAEILRAARARESCESVALAIDDIEESFATLFRGDNPRFDAPKFYAACDPTYGGTR